MEDNLVVVYLLYPTTKAIWDVVNLAYPNFEDSSLMFDLRTRACNLKQEDNSVTYYFNMLTKIWQELDLFNQQN